METITIQCVKKQLVTVVPIIEMCLRKQLINSDLCSELCLPPVLHPPGVGWHHLRDDGEVPMVTAADDTEVEDSVLAGHQGDLLEFVGPVALLPHEGGPGGPPVLQLLAVTRTVVVLTAVPAGGDRPGSALSQHNVAL